MDGLNEHRRQRVADLMADYHDFQRQVMSIPIDPPYSEDYEAIGYVELRRCAGDAQVLRHLAGPQNFTAMAGTGPEEREKAELQQIHLDIFTRRHETQKIYLRQCFIQRWIERREDILQDATRRDRVTMANLCAIDSQLYENLQVLTDEYVYSQMWHYDLRHGRWTAEDPDLHAIHMWWATIRP